MQSLYTALLVYLAVESRRDIREKEISVKNTIRAAMIAMFLRGGTYMIQHTAMTAGDALVFLLCGAIPGGLLLLFGWITRQAIGYGDGLLLLICGFYLGGMAAGLLFVIGLFILFPVSLGLLITRRANRGTQLPFAPGLLAAYLLWLIQNV